MADIPSLLDLFVNVRTSGTGTVSAELAGISSQAKSTDKSVGSSMRSIGSSMSRVGRGMSLFVTAPLALAGAAAIKMGADFDQALTNAVSVTGKTGAAADKAKAQMNDLALTLGAKTAFSAKDAADAMYDLASSGWSVNDMQKGLNGIMALAAATQTDLADATGTVTATLASFKMESSDSGHVSDVFTAAINKSRLQMDDLSVGMKYAAPVAASFGLSLEETTAALAEMADKGIEGSQAGTTLRAALSSMASPIGQAKDTLAELGVSLEQVNPQTHSLAQIMNTLEVAGMDTSDAIKLFGREASSGMLAVAQTGVPALLKLTMALEDSGGTAERTAKMQLDTLAGAWQNLSGSLETAAIRFEQQVEPALKGLLNALVPLVNRISALPAPIKAVIIGIAAFAAALGPLLLAAGLLLQAWGTITVVFAASSVTLASIVAVAIPVIAAVVALAAIGIVLYKNWNRVSPVLQRVGQAISNFLAPVRNLASVVKAFVTGNWTGKTSKQFNALSPALQKTAIVISKVVQVLRGGLAVALKFVRSQAQVLINWWRANLPLIQKVGAQVFEGLRKLVVQSLSGLVKLIKGIIGGLIVFWRLNHKELTAIAKAAWDVIKTIVKTAIHIVLDIIKLAMQVLTGDWKGAWNTIKDILKTLWDAMVRLIKDSLTIFKNVIKAGWNTIKALTKQTWEDIKTMLGSAWDAIKSAASSAWQAISEAIWNPIEDAYNKIVDFVNNIIEVVNSVLKAFGQDPITLVTHAGGPSTPTSGQDRNNLQTGRHGNARIRAFRRGGVYGADRGGIAGPGRLGLVGEAGEREAIVNLDRRTPESQYAFREAARSPNARGGRHAPDRGHIPLGSLGYRMYASGGMWYPKTAAVNQYVEGHWPVQGSTYPGHGADGDAMNSVDWMTGQGWGVRATGAFLERGNQIVDYLLQQQKMFTDYIIWQRKMYDSGGVGTYHGGGGYPAPTTVSGWHEDHVHWESLENNAGPHVMGGKSAGTGPSIAELIWQKLSGILPSVPSFGGGVVGSAAATYLNGYKGWIHDWLLSKFGGSTGITGGNSPKGLTIGEALSSGGWPSNLVVPASGIVWRESGGNAHAQNPSGARGLMQIMPGTASGVGANYGKLYDPIYNTSTGKKVYDQAGGFSPWVTTPGGDYTNKPVTGYDYGGLIKRDHLAKVHANELYMPLDHPHVEKTAQTALGTAELRQQIHRLEKALTDGGIRVKDYGDDAKEVIVVGAREGGLGAMKSRQGKDITISTVKDKTRGRVLSGVKNGGW